MSEVSAEGGLALAGSSSANLGSANATRADLIARTIQAWFQLGDQDSIIEERDGKMEGRMSYKNRIVVGPRFTLGSLV